MCIGAAANKPRWLVDYDVNFFLNDNTFPVRGNAVGIGFDFCAKPGDNAAVDGDAALLDEFLAGASRADACFREEFLQADKHGAAVLFRFCLRQTEHALTVFETALFLEDFHALETFQHVTARCDLVRGFQAGML